jgi:hypothetical protein
MFGGNVPHDDLEFCRPFVHHFYRLMPMQGY